MQKSGQAVRNPFNWLRPGSRRSVLFPEAEQIPKKSQRETNWKRSDGWRNLKLIYKRLIGKEPRLKCDLQIPMQRLGDWWISTEMIQDNQVVYSCGVGEDIDFELNLIDTCHVEVFSFDPTPNSAAWLRGQQLPTQFHYYPWAIAEQDGSLYIYPRIRHDGSQSSTMFSIVAEAQDRDDGLEVPARNITGILSELGHNHVDVLKMDIEGAEYGALRHLLASTLRPTQILIEFHHRFPGVGVAATVQAVTELRDAGYGLASISSSGREFTFIHSP